MTNKEAVYRQDVLDLAKKGVLVSNGNYESVCKAINELPSVNPQLCEDAISRQAVLDILKREGRKWGNNYRDWVDAIEEIKNLSSVNPTKTGHWIEHREHCENLGVLPSGLGAYEWCSNCDCGIDVKEWHRNNYNYCPNCGCYMVEPQERSGEE